MGDVIWYDVLLVWFVCYRWHCTYHAILYERVCLSWWHFLTQTKSPNFQHFQLLPINLSLLSVLQLLPHSYLFKSCFLCAPRAAVTQVISFPKLAAASRSLYISRGWRYVLLFCHETFSPLFYFSCSYRNHKVFQQRFSLSFIDDLLISSLHLFKFILQRTVCICQAKPNIFSASMDSSRKKSLFVICFYS